MLVLVVLNGYPGVGKLAIGRELAKLLPRRIFSNHLLLDAASALSDRREAGFQHLRRELRNAVFRSLSHLDRSNRTFVILTEQQSSKENEKRLVNRAYRDPHSTKLCDPVILRIIRDTEDIYHFTNNAAMEFDLDVGEGTEYDAAKMIEKRVVDHVNAIGVPSASV